MILEDGAAPVKRIVDVFTVNEVLVDLELDAYVQYLAGRQQTLNEWAQDSSKSCLTRSAQTHLTKSRSAKGIVTLGSRKRGPDDQ